MEQSVNVLKWMMETKQNNFADLKSPLNSKNKHAQEIVKDFPNLNRITSSKRVEYELPRIVSNEKFNTIGETAQNSLMDKFLSNSMPKSTRREVTSVNLSLDRTQETPKVNNQQISRQVINSSINFKRLRNQSSNKDMLPVMN